MFYTKTTSTFECSNKGTVESVQEDMIWSEETPEPSFPKWERGYVRDRSVTYELLGGLELLEEYIGAGRHSIECILLLAQKIKNARSQLYLVVEDRGTHSNISKKYSRNTVFSLVDGDFDLKKLDHRIDHGYFFTSRLEAMKRVFS